MPTLYRTAAVLLLLVVAGPAVAKDDALKRASDLRNASQTDWEAKRYAEAAEKLRQAAAIYDGLAETPVRDLAITLRALIWNEKDAGEHKNVPGTFVRLLRHVTKHPEVDGELSSALDALWQTASSQKTFDAAKGVMTPVLEAAYSLGHDRVAGQMLHSTGSLAVKHKQHDVAIIHFRKAIEKREQIGDRIGLCWSHNNLANLHVQERNDPLAALEDLDHAHDLVHSWGVLQPQRSVAINMGMALDKLTAQSKDGTAKLPPAAHNWIKRIATRTAKSRTGTHVSFGRIARTWLAWVEGSDKQSVVDPVVKGVLGIRARDLPVEVRADIVLRCAEAEIRIGRAKSAARRLSGLEAGTGPCASHLKARAATLEAVLLAESRSTQKDLPEAAMKAFELWKAETDRRGQKDAYSALLKAAAEAGVDTELADIQKAYNNLKAEGVPGGPGGFATSSGNVRKMRQLEWDDGLFMIRKVEDGIEVADLATDAEHVIPIVWMPKNIGFNGLSLQLFGGYIVVKNLNYGGSASASGGPGEATLDDLGDYWPVPATGALIVQRNGAIRYRAK